MSLREHNLDVHLANVTTSGATAVAYVPVPFTGVVVRAYGCQYASVSGAPTTVTVSKIDSLTGTSATIGTIVFATGAATGLVTQAADVSALGVGVSEGDAIAFTSDGASDNGTVPATFTAILRRGI
jgi:hypothetical protein